MQYLFEQKHRVNFILSHELHSHLETAARVRQVSKSTYLRGLIRNDWQEKLSLADPRQTPDDLLQVAANAFAAMMVTSEAFPPETKKVHQALAQSILVTLRGLQSV